jgi:acyl-CoA synthetase (AMP-forming)/AMP-acid ligase II
MAEMTAQHTPLTVEGIGALARERETWILWADGRGVHTWGEFGARVGKIARACESAGVRPGQVVVIPAEERLESLAWGFGAAAAGAVVAPLRGDRSGEVEAWKAHFEVAWRVREDRLVRDGEGSHSVRSAGLFGELRGRGHPGLILSTGGTTGTQKLVLHDFASLLATVPVRSGRTRRTLPLMRFDHIGGLDMAWRALAAGQTLIEPPSAISPETVAEAVESYRVEVLPATPSFLNLLLLSEAHLTHDLGSLRIVPYGAEPMAEGLLDRLRSALPHAEFLQRFGTSETGTLPVIQAGAGLRLNPAKDGFEWKIVNDELWVLSPSRAIGYLSCAADGFEGSGWFRTGDLAERLPDGSIRILGRRGELINVGGEKVLPAEVEGILLTHPLVADCRVVPEANAVLGQVVSAEIVWLGPEIDAVAVKRRICEHASTRLARHKLPVVVRLVGGIEATRNLKKPRLAHT